MRPGHPYQEPRAVRRTRRGQAGFALIMTVVMLSVALMTLAGVLYYAFTSGIWTQRTVERSEALAAAEAATENVVARMQSDFRTGGAALVAANVATYSAMVPDASGVPEWAGFEFLNPASGAPGTYVQQVRSWRYGTLPGRYGGVGSNVIYHVISNVRRPSFTDAAATNTPPVVAAKLQEVVLAQVPIASFALWYNLDLELHPYYDWTVQGRVHSNRTNWFNPSGAESHLTFMGPVTAVGRNLHDDHPQDPEARVPGVVTYQSPFNSSQAGSLSLVFGPYNDEGAHALIDMPPASGVDPIQTSRLYNRANLRIVVSDAYPISNPRITGGGYPTGIVSALASVTFRDAREGKDVQALRLRMSSFTTNYNTAQFPASPPRTIYIADLRTPPANTIPAVMVTEASYLRNHLTLVTPGPLYTVGDFNTVNPRRAMVAADAVTVLSMASTNTWDESYTSFFGTFAPVDTTNNMAVITGIVPSAGLQSSGGVLNSVRLLQDWTGCTLALNGSIAVPFRSLVATGTWQGTKGTVYNPPDARLFTLNPGFTNPATGNLPYNCPVVYTVMRTRSEIIQPGTVE